MKPITRSRNENSDAHDSNNENYSILLPSINSSSNRMGQDGEYNFDGEVEIDAAQSFAVGALTQSFYFSKPPKEDAEYKGTLVGINTASKPPIPEIVDPHQKSPSPGLIKLTKLLRDANTKYNMGVLFSATRRYDKCLEYLHRSLSIRKFVLGIQHVLVMQVQEKLGEIYQTLEKFDHARYHYYVAYKNVVRREGEGSSSVDAERLRYILTNELGVMLTIKTETESNESGSDQETYDESDGESYEESFRRQVVLVDLDNGAVF